MVGLSEKDVRGAAKEVKREKSRTKKATLNYLMMAQTYLSTKVSKGDLTMLPKLKEIQFKINAWFDDEAEKVKAKQPKHRPKIDEVGKA